MSDEARAMSAVVIQAEAQKREIERIVHRSLKEGYVWRPPPGYEWARKRGVTHVTKLSPNDAYMVADYLRLGCSEREEALTDMLYDHLPWQWLEYYDRAGGDIDRLFLHNSKCRRITFHCFCVTCVFTRQTSSRKVSTILGCPDL